MRTFDRDSFVKADGLWKSGDYGHRWYAVRRIAAERGFIYPPTGTAHDDRESGEPSQRAIIYRALAENPAATEAIVRRSASWSQVVDGIIGLERRLGSEADEMERDVKWERKDEPRPRQALMSIHDIIQRIADS